MVGQTDPAQYEPLASQLHELADDCNSEILFKTPISKEQQSALAASFEEVAETLTDKRASEVHPELWRSFVGGIQNAKENFPVSPEVAAAGLFEALFILSFSSTFAAKALELRARLGKAFNFHSNPIPEADSGGALWQEIHPSRDTLFDTLFDKTDPHQSIASIQSRIRAYSEGLTGEMEPVAGRAASGRSSKSKGGQAQPDTATRLADATAFWNGAAESVGSWVKVNLPSLVANVIGFAKNDESATGLLLAALKKCLADLIDADAATSMRRLLIEQHGPTEFYVCSVFKKNIYITILSDDYKFTMSSKLCLKVLLIEGIRKKLEGLDEEQLRTIYALAVEDTADERLPQRRPGPESVPAEQARFKNRPKGETAPDFIKRVYGPWLGDLSRQELKRINEPAYRGLYAYEDKIGRRISREHEGFELPTRSELLDRELAQAGPLLPGEEERRRRRLADAALRRQRQP
jgi:hypothetical protein